MIKIYCDGACNVKEKIGGTGTVIIFDDDSIIKLSQCYGNTTNSRMDLMALINGLELLKQENEPITVYSDSQYLVNTINCNWKKNKNNDLWDIIFDFINNHSIKFIWVKGHANNQYNNECDRLAKKAIENY